jgi:hypothetical protein
MEPIVSKDKSAEKALARELVLRKMMDRYWNDAEYRNLKNEANKKRSREMASCSVCKKSMCSGSMRSHTKICKGFKEPTPLELLTKCMIELNL